MQKIELFTMPDYNKRIVNWIHCNGLCITNQTTVQSKDTIILYYYSMFSDHGVCLHFKTSIRQRKPGYLFHPYTDLKIPKIIKITSILTSSKPTKIKHFTHFHHTKKSPNTTPKSSQTLINRGFNRTQPKIALNQQNLI